MSRSVAFPERSSELSFRDHQHCDPQLLWMGDSLCLLAGWLLSGLLNSSTIRIFGKASLQLPLVPKRSFASLFCYFAQMRDMSPDNNLGFLKCKSCPWPGQLAAKERERRRGLKIVLLAIRLARIAKQERSRPVETETANCRIVSSAV